MIKIGNFKNSLFKRCRGLMLLQVTNGGLSVDIVEGDYSALVEVMGHLMAVKERQQTTDNIFDPLKQTIELLKNYGQEMSDEVHQLLQVLRILI